MSAHSSDYSEASIIDEEDPRWADDRAYCICQGRDNGEFMINCEGCEEWYHGRCVGIAESQGPHIDNYYCPKCAAAGKGHTTYKGLGKRGPDTRGDVETSAPKRQKLSLDEKKKFDMHRRREESERRRAERAEKNRARDDSKKREREEAAVKFYHDSESRARESEMKKKKDEEDVKLRREKMRANIASTIEEAFQKDKDSKSIDKDLLENLKPIPQLAEDIEVALFEVSNNSMDKTYLHQYRTLVHNLRDVKNTTLRFRILKGLLKPNVLVTMDSEQLANKDIAQYRQKRDSELLLQTMKPKDTDRLYVKTDIGLELVPNPEAGDEADMDYVDNALDSLLGAKQHKDSVDSQVPSETGEESVVNKSESIGSAATEGSVTPLGHSGGQTKTRDRSDSFDARSGSFSKSPGPSTPLKLSFGAPPLSSSYDGTKNTVVNLNEIAAVGNEGLEEPEFEAPDAMEMENDSKPDHNSFGVSTPENSDDESNPFGFHVEGPELGENLPRVLKVEHRMDLKQLLDYLPKLDSSSSRARTTMYFSVSDTTNESSYENYARLYQHLKEINRAGVFQLHKSDVIGVPPSFFKELYIFPLGATDPKPKFIDDSKNYDRDLHNTLIGVFLTEKNGSKHKSSSAAKHTMAPSPPPSQAAAVTPEQTQAQLDGIASLIAALGKNQPTSQPPPPPPAANPLAAPFNLASFITPANPLASVLSAASAGTAIPNQLAALLASTGKPPMQLPPKPAEAPYDPLAASPVAAPVRPSGSNYNQALADSYSSRQEAQHPPPPPNYQQQHSSHYRQEPQSYSPNRHSDYPPPAQDRGRDYRGGYDQDNRGTRYDDRDRDRGYDRRGSYDDRDRGGSRGQQHNRGRGRY